MADSRKRPIRRCIGCGQRAPKRSLLRLVRTPDGDVIIDADGKKPGRGAYLCPRRECIDAAFAGDSLGKSLRTDSLPPQTRKRLHKQIANLLEDEGGGEVVGQGH